MRPITKLFLAEATDRVSPKLTQRMEKMMTASFMRLPVFRDAVEKGIELADSPHEVVEIVSRDGLKLKGHWFGVPNAKRTVVAMHGWRSTWHRDFGTSSQFLLGLGCNVLYAEQRGQGESEGDYMTFGVKERFDAADWAAFADGKTGGKYPIYLLGVSMGASTVMMAANLDLPERVKGIVADCGYTSMEDIFRSVCENMLHLSYSVRREDVKKEIKNKTGIEIDEVSTLDTLRESKLPVLLIHGEKDDFVPVKMTLENAAAAGDRATVLTVPNAEHCMSFYHANETYTKAVIEFFEKFDRT